MRRFIVFLTWHALFCSPLCAQQVEIDAYRKTLETHGIRLDTYGTDLAAWVPPAAVKHLSLLRLVPRLVRLVVQIDDAKQIETCLKEIARIPGVTELQISAPLSPADVKRIAALERMRVLEIDAPRFRDEHVRELHAFKNLKRLELTYDHITNAAFVDLKRSLPRTHFTFVRTIAPVVVARGDDLLRRLQKQKFNVARDLLLAERRMIYLACFNSPPLYRLDHSRRLLESAIDLRDPALIFHAAEIYVQEAERARRIAELMHAAGSGALEQFHHIHYESLNAQLMLERLQKQFGPKSDAPPPQR